MKVHNMTLLNKFANSWNKDWVEIRSIKFLLTLKLISEEISIDCVGVQIERKGTLDYRKFRHKFFEGTKEPIRVSTRIGNDRLSLCSPFGAICYRLIMYSTLEGQYIAYHGYHFHFLNILHHGGKVNIPFFLYFYLVNKISSTIMFVFTISDFIDVSCPLKTLLLLKDLNPHLSLFTFPIDHPKHNLSHDFFVHLANYGTTTPGSSLVMAILNLLFNSLILLIIPPKYFSILFEVF